MGDRGLPLRRQLLTVAGLLSLMMLSVTASGLVAVTAENRNTAELGQVTVPAIIVNSAILQTMSDADASLRGYLAADDPALLDHYDKPRAVAELDQLTALLASGQLDAADRGTYRRQQATQAAAITRWWRYTTAVLASGRHVRAADLITDDAMFGTIRAANAALASRLSADRAGLRAQAGRAFTNGVVALIAATLLVVLGGAAATAWLSRTVASPLIRLRRAVRRRDQGDAEARADEDRGPAEIRSLAITFNETAARGAELAAEQAAALRLRDAVFGAGRAIRCAGNAREAMVITCAQLGAALSARRVMAAMPGTASTITTDAQWHAPDLGDLPDRPEEEVTASLLRSVGEPWSSTDLVVITDLLTEQEAQQDWALRLGRDTGATALILAPVGLGARALGAVCVLTDTGPRQWTQAEAATVQQLANYLARAITQMEDEARRAEYTARLEGLDRQKTEFLATVSHELRTPLTPIQGYLELLSDGDAGPMPDEQKQMLGIIERNTLRLRGLIEDILVLNRIETGAVIASFSQVTLAGLAASTAEDLQPMAGKAGVRLRVSTDANPARISGDQSLLQRALANIVSNAIKFTLRDGTVRLSCVTDPVAGEIVITCQDTGIGIPEADLEHLFTRFFRASNAVSQVVPGTGLGLVIVQAVVDAHGGRLIVDSAEGKGTTVTLRFPLTLAALDH